MLRSIAQWEVHAYWERLVPFLNRIIALEACDNSLADIQHFLMLGRFQAWHDQAWKMVAVTTQEVFGANPQLPTRRVMLVLFCAGEVSDETMSGGVDQLQEWASKVYGIKTLRVIGREGWAKKLPGFKRVATVIERSRP